MLHHCCTTQMSLLCAQRDERRIYCAWSTKQYLVLISVMMNRPSGDHLHRMSIAVTSPFQVNDACTHSQLFCDLRKNFFRAVFTKHFSLFPLHLAAGPSTVQQCNEKYQVVRERSFSMQRIIFVCKLNLVFLFFWESFFKSCNP